MSPIPLQVVLLFAVATSQIFGGISCCCLGRSNSSSLLAVSNSTVSELALRHSSSSELKKGPSGTCPRCSVRKSSPISSMQTASNHRQDYHSRVCGDGNCRCVNHAANASTSNNPPSLSCDANGRLSPILDVKPQSALITPVFAKFEIPVRFGGRSWQSIACVWNI